jgi:hypothetical protein
LKGYTSKAKAEEAGATNKNLKINGWNTEIEFQWVHRREIPAHQYFFYKIL